MIRFSNRTRKHRISAAFWRRRATALLAAARLGHAELSLTFVGDSAMRRLNREYRGKDRPTDVLSFPQHPPFRVPRAGDGPVLLGDVVIDLDVAARQARDYAAPLRDEIARLLIHGILHLAGHDHEETAERRRMERAERRLAAAIGLPDPYAGSA